MPTKKHTINQKETLTIALLGIFALLWVIVAIPFFMSSDWFQSLIPPGQYFLYSLGFMAAFILFFGMPLTWYFRRKFVTKDIIRVGLSAWAAESFILDMWYPPFYVNPAGQILAIQGALSGTSVDGMVSWCWQQLSIGGPALFYFTYLVAPFIVMVILALVLAPKQFIGLFTK
jgi:hypothetical protein